MPLPLGPLLLAAAAAATPAADPTPTPTPLPVSAGPRTLQDVARERRLSSGTKGKGSLVTISGSPSTVSPAPKGTPEVAAAPQVVPEPDVTWSVRVTTVTNDGIVDPSGGVRVNGTVRNAGSKPACNVVITATILDSRGVYLSSGQVNPDITVIPAGDVVSFHAIVQAPPGVRGGRSNPDRKDVTDGSTTMAGDWRLLGRSEATVASASEDCVK